MGVGLLRYRVALLLAVMGVVAVAAYYLRSRIYPDPPRQSTAMYMYEGGYLPVRLDSGELANTSNKMKLLYRTQIAHPDPKAVISLLNLTGTELGEGSFIRVKCRDVHDWFVADLRHRRYRVDGGGNPITVELWGAPRTRNRLRVEKLFYYYPDRPIEPDAPPGEPRPARSR